MNPDRNTSEGGRPDRVEKGYQPSSNPNTQGEDTSPQGGYQPTSEQDNPTNVPPGAE